MEVSSEIPEWAFKGVKYHTKGGLLEEKQVARKVRNKAAHFTPVDGVLYMRGFSTSLFRRLSLREARYVMAGIHEGACRIHSGGRALGRKVLKAGYY